jgi:hypothetical protein
MPKVKSPKKTKAQKSALQKINKIFSGITPKERAQMLRDSQAMESHHKKSLGKDY